MCDGDISSSLTCPALFCLASIRTCLHKELVVLRQAPVPGRVSMLVKDVKAGLMGDRVAGREPPSFTYAAHMLTMSSCCKNLLIALVFAATVAIVIIVIMLLSPSSSSSHRKRTSR